MNAHLTRFPSLQNGLGAIESTIVRLVADGARAFGPLFEALCLETRQFGLGDAQIWSDVMRLSRARQPLLRVQGEMMNSGLELTGEGESVLEGRADQMELNGIDLWLGGMHLNGRQGQVALERAGFALIQTASVVGHHTTS